MTTAPKVMHKALCLLALPTLYWVKSVAGRYIYLPASDCLRRYLTRIIARLSSFEGFAGIFSLRHRGLPPDQEFSVIQKFKLHHPKRSVVDSVHLGNILSRA